MRGVLGILAGLVAVVATMMLVTMIGSLLASEVPAVDARNIESIKATYAGLSTGTWLLMLLSWFLGALAGAAVAKKIAGRSWAAWTVAGLILAYLLLTVVMLPMPGWMKFGALAAPLLAGFLANRLVPDRVDVASDEAGRERAADETAADADL
jgi:hypothetical protein